MVKIQRVNARLIRTSLADTIFEEANSLYRLYSEGIHSRCK